jgi:oxygen-independent coproporphyrinogen-3 oxidase
MKKYSEIDEVARTYPVDFGSVSDLDVWRSEDLHLFFSIPFCKGKCPFCAFNSSRYRDEDVASFLQALKQEIELHGRDPHITGRPITSIWIGGGTPATLPLPSIGSLLDHVRRTFAVNANTEITFEANPTSLSGELLKMLRAWGITRISLGIQSFNDKYLKMLGRGYTSSFAARVIHEVYAAGLELNIDMMYRFPGQTCQEVVDDFCRATLLGVSHISAFCLILWPSMPLARRVADGRLPQQPDFDEYIRMYNSICDCLQGEGVQQYAHNFFSRPGKKCVYHMGRWEAPQAEVLGLGPGAFSFVNGFTYCNQHERTIYVDHLLRLERRPVQAGKRLTLLEWPSRYMVLGCRFLKIDLADFRKRFGVDARDLYQEQFRLLLDDGLVELAGDDLTVTKRGRPLILDVGRAFYTENNKTKLQPQYYILGFISSKEKSSSSVKSVSEVS